MWGVVFPLSITFIVLLAVLLGVSTPAIKWGIATGLGVALVQSLLSVGAMQWAWQRKFFYWVWGGGVLFRFAVFAGMAYVVYFYTSLHLVATLISMVTATTLFMVVESATFLGKT